MSDFFDQIRAAKTPFIIAELGANYGGIDVVQKMVEAAATSGVDMVKFQTYRAETISTPGSYFTFEDGSKVSQYDFFKTNELSKEHHVILNNLCRELNIAWTSTPSHVSDLDLLESFDLPCYKTGSDDLTNLPFLKAIAEKNRPMLVSTGMCSLAEIEAAVSTIFATGNNKLILLHCVVSYPSQIKDANLLVIETLKKAFNVPIGLSDHTQDEFTSVLATQMGIAVIEKHFTLDHNLKLPDHEASLDPSEFKRLVERVRMVPEALGNGIKSIQPTEKKWRKAARKSLFAAIDIPEKTIIDAEHIEIRRPSDGIHPHNLPLVLGREAKMFISAGTMLEWDMV